MKALFPIFAIFLLASCQNDAIETRRVPKEAAPAVGMGAMAMGAAAGGMPTDGVAPPSEKPTGVRWSVVPAGWTEKPGSAMRVATFELPKGDGKAEVSVVALPGDVGGELANVNRWRGQISLPPLSEAELSAARKTVRSGLGPVLFYDFVSGGTKKTRLVAGMIQVNGTTWFFKLMGDDKAAAAAKPAFLKFLEGLKSDAA